jgi:hypothetical protein
LAVRVFSPLRLTTWFALLLAAVLVMTQMLGVVHAITHGVAGSLMQTSDHSPADDQVNGVGHAHAESNRQGSGHFLEALFSSHQGASDCRLYDQISHGAPLVSVTASALPAAPPTFAVAIFAGKALARWAALFDARGPPLTV